MNAGVSSSMSSDLFELKKSFFSSTAGACGSSVVLLTILSINHWL
jgi:hypothetical protein